MKVAYIYKVGKKYHASRGHFELQIRTLIGSDMGAPESITYHADRAAAKAAAAKAGAKAWNY